MDQPCPRAARGPLADLRRQWRLAAAVALFTLLVGAVLVGSGANFQDGLRWCILVGGSLAYQLRLLWRGLPSNHPLGSDDLLPSLGLANTVTLARGLALAILAGFLFAPWPAGGWAWLPALLYTLAALADILDGHLARTRGQSTILGATLDIEFDALGLLTVVCLGIWFGQLPPWYLALGLSRYLFLAGQHWLWRRGRPVLQLPESNQRRVVAGLQMGYLTVILWPIIGGEGSRFAAIWFGAPLALSFLRDWLVVAGWASPHSPVYLGVLDRLRLLLTHQVGPLLRGLAIVLFLTLLLANREHLVAGFAWPGLPGGSAVVALGLGLIAMPLLALGAVGRLAALALIVPAATHVFSHGLGWLNGLLLADLVAILHLGTGAFSLWQPEDRLLNRRTNSREEST